MTFSILNSSFLALKITPNLNVVKSFYGHLLGIYNSKPVDFAEMSIKSAELTKVTYNTFISMKIAFANTTMEICHKTGADIDQVIGALSKATQRLISPTYLRGGMGDGGGCFLPGQLVMTASGPRPIETIQPGDLVLSEGGKLRKVIKRWDNWWKGKLSHIQVPGFPTIVATEKSQILCQKRHSIILPDF
jgi:UDP-glucose 6-dehydrogenase